MTQVTRAFERLQSGAKDDSFLPESQREYPIVDSAPSYKPKDKQQLKRVKKSFKAAVGHKCPYTDEQVEVCISICGENDAVAVLSEKHENAELMTQVTRAFERLQSGAKDDSFLS